MAGTTQEKGKVPGEERDQKMSVNGVSSILFPFLTRREAGTECLDGR